MRDPSRVRVWGPLAPYAQGFRSELEGTGYAPSTTVVHLRLMGHLSRWLAGQHLDGASLTSAVVGEYLVERRRVGRVRLCTIRGLSPLLGYLRQVGVVREPVGQEPSAPVDRLLARYARFLVSERGLAEATVVRNVALVRPFLSAVETADAVAFERLDAASVTRFVLTRCRESGRGGSTARMMTALRSLLGFLHVAGLTDRPLAGAVPWVASWRLAGLPKALDGAQVTALLASCDRCTVVGRRDLAILTVLVRLGLRAGEVAALRLDDIDWRAGEVRIRGKANRYERLPLPSDVGEVIVAYLRAPQWPATSGSREVFARVRAPHGPLTRLAVTQVVARAAGRAGMAPVYAHRLRHTAATAMLHQGGSLTEIGQVLRHRHMLTTAIYAKVDTHALRQLARPWPGGAA